MFPVVNRISCWVLALVVLGAASGCALGPPRTESEKQVDKETADRVLAALNADEDLYAQHISVHADRGKVRLTGYVWTQPELLEALRVAGLVPGVTGVVDDLELERGGLDNSPISR